MRKIRRSKIRVLTIREARQRTGLDLVSDRYVKCNTSRWGLLTVAEAQKRMERLNPAHKDIREAAMHFFASKGLQIYPRGITVRDIMTCADFAIFSNSRISFAECSTAGWVESEDIRKKKRLAKYGKLIFVIEHSRNTLLGNRRRDVLRLKRVENLARHHRIYCMILQTKQLRNTNLTNNPPAFLKQIL